MWRPTTRESAAQLVKIVISSGVQSSRCRVFRDDTRLEVGFQNVKSLTSHAKQWVWTLERTGEPVRENWVQQDMETG